MRNEVKRGKKRTLLVKQVEGSDFPPPVFC